MLLPIAMTFLYNDYDCAEEKKKLIVLYHKMLTNKTSDIMATSL